MPSMSGLQSSRAYRLVLFLTQQCDKDCFYCDIPGIKEQRPTDFGLLKRVFPLVNGRDDLWKTFTITGGEPGLVDEEVLDWLFSEIKPCHDVRVNTNGLFVEKGYLDRYSDKITYVGLHPNIHVSADLRGLAEDPRVVVFQPVSAHEVDKVKPALEANRSTTWNLMPMLKKNPALQDDHVLTRQQAELLRETAKEACNVNESTLETLSRMAKFDQDSKTAIREACSRTVIHPTLDFATGSIVRCPLSYTQADRHEMTDENIKRMIDWTLFDDGEDCACSTCDDCLRYFDHFFGVMLKQK